MKKVLTLIAASAIAMGASADNWYAGGSLGFLHDDTEDKTSATILPEIGYNFSDQWAFGTQVGYSYVGKGDVHNHAFVLDPYARFTFYKKGIVSLFCDGGIDFSLGATHISHGGDTDCSVTIGFGIKPGISVDLNKSFSLVAHLGLLGYTYGNDAAKAGGRFTGGGLDLYNAVNFGLYYNF